MNLFYRRHNNGVFAIVSAEVYAEIKKYKALPEHVRCLRDYPGPIFTFVNENVADHSTFRGYVTGTTRLMDRLLRDAIVSDGDFAVPFSNAFQINGDEVELRFRTTGDELVETFGLVRSEAVFAN